MSTLKRAVRMFRVHGWFGREGEEDTGDWRSLSVALTLVDYIRRRELSMKCRVALYNTPLARETGPAVLVMPEGTRYIDVVPEEMPALVDRHINAGDENDQIQHFWF